MLGMAAPVQLDGQGGNLMVQPITLCTPCFTALDCTGLSCLSWTLPAHQLVISDAGICLVMVYLRVGQRQNGESGGQWLNSLTLC